MNCPVAFSAQQPRLVADADLGVRVGDREREKVIARLGQAFTQGYLSLTDYEARLDKMFAFAVEHTGGFDNGDAGLGA